MTEQTSGGTTPEPTLPPYEPADPGSAAPAVTVQRETPGATPPSRRSSGIRWAIALIGVAIVIGITAAVFALASGRPTPSTAVGYMPADVVTYSEYRFDLPGDQRQKVAAFLSAFPGFDDQAAIDAKLDETYERLIAGISNNGVSYAADIEPWFGGQIASGSPAFAIPDGGPAALSTFGNAPLLVVTVKDKAKAADWIGGLDESRLTRGDYHGAVVFTGVDTGSGPRFAIAVTDAVMIFGTEDAVHAAVDSKGNGTLASDPEFKAAFSTASEDYVTFSFIDSGALAKSYIDVLTARGIDPKSTSIDDAILPLVPAWVGSFGRFENDALVGTSAHPAVDLGYDATNKKSSLLGFAPPGTVVYSELHDAGAAAKALLDRFRGLPELKDAFSQVDTVASAVGGLDELLGWWGDVAIVITPQADGTIGGGLLIKPTDGAAAKQSFAPIKGLLALGGGQLGVKFKDVQHGDATVTVVDFSGALAASGDKMPAGYKPEIAFAVTDDVVVIGYGEAFVESVLDAGPGPSLADDARVGSVVKRVGEENLGLTFVDVRAIRELVEAGARTHASPDEWAHYTKEIQPFLLPFDALASSVREDGALNRLESVVTVTKP